MESENRPYKNSELYLGLDFVKLLGLTMILAALVGPLSERITIVMLGEPVGIAAGTCTLLLLISVCLIIFMVTFFNISYNWGINKDAEEMHETELDINETLKRIDELDQKIKENDKKYEAAEKFLNLTYLSQFLNTDVDTVYRLVETDWHEVGAQYNSKEVQDD